MPQPIKATGLSWSCNVQWVANHEPRCVQLIGQICLCWTRVERDIVGLVSGIMGKSGRSEGGGWAINPNWIVSAALSEVESIRTRIDISDAILIPILKDSSLLSEWELVKKRLRARAKERNAIVHAQWGHCDNYSKALINADSINPLMLWTEKDFEETVRRIEELERQLHAFMKKVLNDIADGKIQNRFALGVTAN